MGVGSSKPKESERTCDLPWAISALGALSKISRKLQSDFGKRDKRYTWLCNIDVSTWYLRQHLNNILSKGPEEIPKEISMIAQDLDIVFRITPSAEDISYLPHQMERRKKVQDSFDATLSSYDGLIKLLDFRSPEARECWLSLQLRMERLTNRYELQNGILDEEIEAYEIRKDLKPPDEDACRFVTNVLNAASCRCGDHVQRDVRLRLGTHKSNSRKPKPTSLCVLMGRSGTNEPPLQWHELEISAEPEAEKGPENQLCICDYLKGQYTASYQLNFVLAKDVLKRSLDMAVERTLKHELKDQINLKSLIDLKEKNWTLDVKWILAILLAYSLLYLHGGSHVTSIWQRENIFFFLEGSKVPLRPFLGNCAPTASKESPSSHGDSPFVMLGAMLLEVFLGESLESFLETKGIKQEESLYFRALKAFEQLEFLSFPPLFRRAIRACLTPATFARANDIETLRLVFFSHIVAPLESAAWEHFTTLDPRNPDEAAASRFDLARGIEQTVLYSTSLTTRQRAPSPMRAVPENDPGPPIRQSSTPLFINNDTSPLGLSSDMTPTRSDLQTEDWTEWLKEFVKFRDPIFDRIPSMDGNQHRARVTIIDTGVDVNHPFIQERWSQSHKEENMTLFHDFVDSQNTTPIDEDGHGTFIAGLLLELAPDAQLSVARIGTTTKAIREDSTVIHKIVEV
ncbi:hypothetical protein E8E14_002603 [Neopestalotiopsis sp. 37M]|nr:hypothetical protein E8E14_002603 [Neopestalotiopsis sp. 37M]